MQLLVFQVEKNMESHEIIFMKSGTRFSTLCTCHHKDYSFCCEHQLKLLKGDTEGCIEGAEQIEELKAWVSTMKVYQLLQNIDANKDALAEAERELRRNKKRVASLKQVITRASNKLAKLFQRSEMLHNSYK